MGLKYGQIGRINFYVVLFDRVSTVHNIVSLDSK